MEPTFKTANEAFQRLVDAGRLVSVEACWKDFLNHLEKRCQGGADLGTVRSADEIERARKFLEEGRLAKIGTEAVEESQHVGSAEQWFSQFNQRPDVLQAVVKWARDNDVLDLLN